MLQEDLSELNYSDKWPMVCEALASFLPLQQHPQAQTKVRIPPPFLPCLVQSTPFHSSPPMRELTHAWSVC